MVFGRTKRVVLRGWLALIATWGVLAAGPSSAPAQDVAAATHDFAVETKFQFCRSSPVNSFQLSPAVMLRNIPSEVAA